MKGGLKAFEGSLEVVNGSVGRNNEGSKAIEEF